VRNIAATCCVVFLLSIAAQAEVEKIATPCDNGICLYWWPKLPPISGWHQDKDQSFHYRINALAPDGSSFVKAEAVMYAEAIYKPRVPETKSLDALIAGDKQKFLQSDPSLTIAEASEMMTGDGIAMRSFTFFPRSQGNWEPVTYGEETEYYLIFTLSSRSKEAFERTTTTYRELIARYKAKL